MKRNVTDMKKWSVWTLVVGCLLLAATSCSKDDDEEGFPQKTKTAEAETCQMSNKVTFNKVGDGNIDRFLAFMPVPKSNIYQRVENVTNSGGELLTDGNYGNQVLYAERSDFYPRGQSAALQGHPLTP